MVRDAATEESDRAVENIARKQLNPHEEARAVRAMLDRGLTQSGAADALGWSSSRVAARVKILELPDRARGMVGAGAIPLSAVDPLRAIGRVAPDLLDAVLAFLDDGNEWAAERLAREPGWVLDSAMSAGGAKTFASYLDTVGGYEISELRLGTKIEEQVAETEKLHKQITPHAYGPPPIRFIDADIDQARAANVLIEFERGRPVIVDRSLYRELAKGAVKRTVEELRIKAAELVAQKKADRKPAGTLAVDPVLEAHRQRDRQLREHADQAHGVNLDLGAGLLTGLSTVDPETMDVARFFVLGRNRPSLVFASCASMTTRGSLPRNQKTAGVSHLPSFDD